MVTTVAPHDWSTCRAQLCNVASIVENGAEMVLDSLQAWLHLQHAFGILVE